VVAYGGRALEGLGVSPDYRTLPNSEYRMWNHGSQTAGDKLRSRKGNSPDRQLRSLIYAKWERMCNCTDNQDVGLEAAIHLKSA
jgi:hypothetical protein